MHIFNVFNVYGSSNFLSVAMTDDITLRESIKDYHYVARPLMEAFKANPKIGTRIRERHYPLPLIEHGQAVEVIHTLVTRDEFLNHLGQIVTDDYDDERIDQLYTRRVITAEHFFVTTIIKVNSEL